MLVRVGLRVGEADAVLAPTLGLLVFALADFKFEIREAVRRHWDGFHAH